MLWSFPGYEADLRRVQCHLHILRQGEREEYGVETQKLVTCGGNGQNCLVRRRRPAFQRVHLGLWILSSVTWEGKWHSLIPDLQESTDLISY